MGDTVEEVDHLPPGAIPNGDGIEDVSSLPHGAIPADESDPGQIRDVASLPPGAVPADQFQSDADKYGGPGQIAATALEQAVSGATLGLSKKLETATGITTPQAIAGREAANPVTAAVANIGGTGAMLTGTGGLGELLEPVGVAAKIGVGAIEGAGIGGINQASDDWSQDKGLDAEKIAASAGIGALLGGAGSAIAEGLGAGARKLGLSKPIVATEAGPATPPPGVPPSPGNPVVDPPTAPTGTKGVKPTTYQDMLERVNQSRWDGSSLDMPQKAELADAISRVEMNNPVNPAQLDSVGDQAMRNQYGTFKEMDDDIGKGLRGYESLQKQELVGKAQATINDLSPMSIPTGDAYEGGKTAIEAFTNQYQEENEALKPIFDNLKTLPIAVSPTDSIIENMIDRVPNIASVIKEVGPEGIAIHPYSTDMGVDKSTYMAAKQVFQSLNNNPEDFQKIWNIKQGLDQNVNPLDQGPGPTQIRGLKSALMDYMQGQAPTEDARAAFKRYAINQQQRQVIEKSFGASVGSPEFGAISKVSPEKIGDKIFASSATVAAAKQILPKEQFNTILANWIQSEKVAATDKGAFSSNKFGSFLRRKQDALNQAFSDNPENLQRLKDLTTIMRILPDAPSINPSGTAKTLMGMLKHANLHDMTWEGLLASIPQKAIVEVEKTMQRNQLNNMLAGKASAQETNRVLQDTVQKTSDKIAKGAKLIFSAGASESRKTNE